MLVWLAGSLAPGTIPDFLTISLPEWRTHPRRWLGRCKRRFGEHCRLAVRSDAHDENAELRSAAGAYLSVLDVPWKQLATAIERVADSLPGHTEDQIMVQTMVTDLKQAGVASTHRVSDGAPWYCVEFSSGDSTAVTAGKASGRQFAIRRDATANCRRQLDPAFATTTAVLRLLQSIESLLPRLPLEIEFATRVRADGQSDVLLLQVRPIVAARHWFRPSRCPRLAGLEAIDQPDPIKDIVGGRSVLSMMSDWNPAELLGSHPRPLAVSLFRRTIACGQWWNARAALGYVNAPADDVELLRVLCGRPWVDVRRSANSLMPRGLAADVRAALVDQWVAHLRDAPELYDKVEFQVFRTVRDLTGVAGPSRVQSAKLSPADERQWEQALTILTRNLMRLDAAAPLYGFADSLRRLSPVSSQPVSWLQCLDLARKGGYAFAALARIAFAAEAQLRSAVQRGALSPPQAEALKASVRSSPLWRKAAVNQRAEDSQCGHLRPGTFEITQQTWAASEFRPKQNADAARAFALDTCEARALQQLLSEAELPADAKDWCSWVQQSRHAREWAKHEFSRCLSAALEAMTTQMGAGGLDRETLSWLTLEQLPSDGSLPLARHAARLSAAALQARLQHLEDQHLIVSPVLRRIEDGWTADSLGVLPNFVGLKAISGPLVRLVDSSARAEPALRGAIVLVRQADPGFDWLFECGIAGLITAWGGANSHMAVRCAEFGLVAAIGCGEVLYARAARAARAHIDPVGGALWLD